MKRSLVTICAVALAMLAACANVNNEVKSTLVQSGFSEENATKLASMDLTPEEVTQLGAAKAKGLDEVALVEMVESLHDRDLKFTISTDMEMLMGQGMNATVLTQLVAMGAIPRWTDDLRALKDADVADVAIVEIAQVRFKDNKEILSGNEYARLKQFGLTDAGLLTFVRKDGTAQQLEKLAEQLALGKSEQEALKGLGM